MHNKVSLKALYPKAKTLQTKLYPKPIKAEESGIPRSWPLTGLIGYLADT